MAEDTADSGEPAKSAGPTPAHGGTSAPVFGGGGSRQRRDAGNGAQEAEMERLNALRRKNNEVRLRREKEAATQQQKNQQLAEEYAQRKKAISEEQAYVRQERLAHLSYMSSKRSQMTDQSRMLLEEEFADDEEFRDLFQRYGHKLRVPMPPPSLMSARSRGDNSRRPAVPSQPRKTNATSDGSAKMVSPGPVEAAAAAAKASAPRRASTVGHDGGANVHSSGARASASAGHGNVAATAGGTGGALPAIDGKSPRGIVGTDEHAPGATETDDEIPEPDRSLMPRKENLRKQQQALLRKSDVTFYKQQMNAHFQKILQAVEMTYSESSKKKSQAALNLAKPRLGNTGKYSSTRGDAA